MSSSGLGERGDMQKPDGDIGLHRESSSRVWIWFVAAFVVQAAAWTVWFVIAAQHKVAEVPLEAAITGKL